MGNEQSQIDPSVPPRTLSSRDVKGVAKYVQDGRARRIVIMTGAGISTSAGIPDFRSPKTGLYSNLQRLNLPHPEAVFDIGFFRENPHPFYVLAKELYPGKFYPTISHAFIALLNEKKLLEMVFTQNIDCLDHAAGVPESKIVEAHGSFEHQSCIECKSDYPDDLMKVAVEKGEPPHCLVPQCNGLVKPNITFFGEALPHRFHMQSHVPRKADLVIVMGTSLTVQPFASLPGMAEEGVPRLLINKPRVGDFGSRLDDVILETDCDAGVRELADALGWREELEELWLEVGGKVKVEEATRLKEQRMAMTKDELLAAEIEKITGEIDKSLQIAKDHEEWVNKSIRKDEGGSSSATKPGSSPLREPLSGILVGTTSQEGIREPPPTPYGKEDASPGHTISPTEQIRDSTLPQHRPNSTAPGVGGEEKKSVL